MLRKRYWGMYINILIFISCIFCYSCTLFGDFSSRYTQKQVYDVVANINDYYKFLPWCKQSEVVKERPEYSVAKLVVGFPPLLESYTSLITLKPHRLVRVRITSRSHKGFFVQAII